MLSESFVEGHVEVQGHTDAVSTFRSSKWPDSVYNQHQQSVENQPDHLKDLSLQCNDAPRTSEIQIDLQHQIGSGTPQQPRDRVPNQTEGEKNSMSPPSDTVTKDSTVHQVECVAEKVTPVDDVFGSSPAPCEYEPLKQSAIEIDQVDTTSSNISHHIEELAQLGIASLRPLQAVAQVDSPAEEYQESSTSFAIPKVDVVVPRGYKTLSHNSEAAIARFQPRRSVSKTQMPKLESSNIDEPEHPIDQASMEQDVLSDDIDDAEEPSSSDELDGELTTPRMHQMSTNRASTPEASRSGLETPRPSIFRQLALRSTISRNDTTLNKQPLERQSPNGGRLVDTPTRAPSIRAQRRPEIGVLGSRPLLQPKIGSRAQQQKDLTEGDRDEYVAIGLLMKAKEREAALQEAVSMASISPTLQN